LRIENHPVLGMQPDRKEIEIIFDGKKLKAFEGEMIATALMAAGIKTFRYTSKRREPRGIFCAIGRCTDCVMEVDGVSNVRTCVTPAKAGMIVNTQIGLGQWKEGSN
jgi:predicted molibdopterin-dependent oxidoreductase YjgC